MDICLSAMSISGIPASPSPENPPSEPAAGEASKSPRTASVGCLWYLNLAVLAALGTPVPKKDICVFAAFNTVYAG